MDWLLYVAFMPFLMPLVLIGVGMTAVEVYQFFRKRGVDHSKSLSRTFWVVLSSVLVLFVPRAIAGLFFFQYITAFVTIWYFGCALYFIWKWGKFVVRLEDMDPNNDPAIRGVTCASDCQCTCHGKAKQPPADGTK